MILLFVRNRNGRSTFRPDLISTRHESALADSRAALPFANGPIL